jgi:Xaa-Pro aminopeptidase
MPDDDGVSLLAGTLKDIARTHGRIGVPLGHETHIRMPAADFDRLRGALGNIEITDAAGIVRALRNLKSEAEIDKIREACRIASDGYGNLPGHARAGQSEREICHALKIDLLARGADGAPFLVGASGPGGYDNIIVGPTDRVLGEGDVLFIDTGTVYDGYFCDFDRNFAFGDVGDEARRAHDVAWRATEAGMAAARPGVTAEALAAAMWAVLEDGGALGNDVGRLGHGLGMQLTELHSNMPGDETVFEPGMVITLEPAMSFAPGKLMVHEENIVIREGAPELLTRRAPREMPVIG